MFVQYHKEQYNLYIQEMGNGIIVESFEWVEQGYYDDQESINDADVL